MKPKSENRLLRDYKAEAISLRAKIDELESSMEDWISKAVAEAVSKATVPLITKIEEQEKEIHRLKAKINKDYSNSSKPPSTNGFKKPPNNREESIKKQGG